MSRARYQLLPSNEQGAESIDTETTSQMNSSAPPVVIVSETITVAPPQQQQQQQQINIRPEFLSTQQSQAQAQPQIVVADSTLNNQQPTQAQTQLPSPAELPSYNDVVRLKKLEANNTNDLPPAYFPNNGSDAATAADQARFPLDPSDIHGIVDDTQMYEQDIGSECMFLSAFMIAFFFNWIGFFASICLLPNAAGKYGALSGFGLSMAKWVTIVRYQEWMNYMNDFQQKLFFWLFIFLGFYLFFRGLINYMTLKYRPIASIDYSRRNRWFTFMD